MSSSIIEATLELYFLLLLSGWIEFRLVCEKEGTTRYLILVKKLDFGWNTAEYNRDHTVGAFKF